MVGVDGCLPLSDSGLGPGGRQVAPVTEPRKWFEEGWQPPPPTHWLTVLVAGLVPLAVAIGFTVAAVLDHDRRWFGLSVIPWVFAIWMTWAALKVRTWTQDASQPRGSEMSNRSPVSGIIRLVACVMLIGAGWFYRAPTVSLPLILCGILLLILARVFRRRPEGSANEPHG